MIDLQLRLASALFLSTLALGCDSATEGGKKDEAAAEADESKKAEADESKKAEADESKESKKDEADDAGEPEATAKADPEELSEEAKYDEEWEKKGCEMLTAELVATTFNVPAGELRQFKIMGCRYNWKSDGKVVEAAISMVNAHKSEKAAAFWHGNATRGMTKEEAKEMMAKVKDRMKERGDIDTKAKESVVDIASDSVVGLGGEEGYQYTDLEGVGDEARVSETDGAIWIRVDNLTFNVSAYQGPPQPPMQINPRGKPKDMIVQAQKEQKEFLVETLDQRKADSKTLALAILSKL